MNELSIVQNNKLIEKLKADISAGYKVLGNFSDQFDIIRVWTSKKGLNKIFAIVASSGKRFNNSGSLLEIESFGPAKNYKVSFMLIADEIKETTITQTTNGETYSINEFVEDFMQTQPDKDLTIYRMSIDGQNPKDIEWIV